MKYTTIPNEVLVRTSFLSQLCFFVASFAAIFANS
jgi:hypothetical protein